MSAPSQTVEGSFAPDWLLGSRNRMAYMHICSAVLIEHVMSARTLLCGWKPHFSFLLTPTPRHLQLTAISLYSFGEDCTDGQSCDIMPMPRLETLATNCGLDHWNQIHLHV